MPDILEQTPGAEGANDQQGASSPEPAEPAKSPNAAAKELPWVQELMKKAAELDSFKKQQADATSRAEREKAEAEGRYQDALALETKQREELETKYQSELRRLKLETEFTRAGLKDPRAIQLFEAGFDPDQMEASEFVAQVKADERNSMYFGDHRTVQKPPPPANGSPDPFDPERDLDKWLRSPDEKKRERAIAYNREKYERKLKKG